MKNIFRAPVDNQHFRDTIEEGKPVNEIASYLSGDEKTKILRSSPNGVVRCWGSIPGEANSRNFEKLNEGDEFLCYRSGHYIALCVVAFTTVNAKLARRLWGETETGKTWELIYFFSSAQLFKIDAEPINSAFGFKEGPVMGFSAISEEKVRQFQSKYGSVANFIKNLNIEENLESKIHDEIKKLDISSPYEAQFYLTDLGNRLEYDTFVPASDSGRKAFDKKLADIVTVRSEELKEYVAPVIFDPISHIDVIWFKDHYQPKFFFEVIHKTGWSEAFLRLELATKHYETSKARVVGTKENEEGFKNAIRRWSGPRENLAYRDYDHLVSLHSETIYHKKMIDEFLY